MPDQPEKVEAIRTDGEQRTRDWPRRVSWQALRQAMRTHDTGSDTCREARAEMTRRIWPVVWTVAAMTTVLVLGIISELNSFQT